MIGQSRIHIARQLTLILALLLPVCLLLAIARGTVNIAPAETLTALIDTLRGQAVGHSAVIIGEIRLPRVLLAALVGAILASSGAAMQGLFRNPLADPSLIGVTAGASLGASIAIVGAGGAMAGLAGITLVSVGAFIGGLLAVILVYRLATSASGTSVATMLLAGIAISALAGAIGNVLEFYSSNETLRRISLWQMGGLDGANYERVAVAGLVAALVLICLPRFSTAPHGATWVEEVLNVCTRFADGDGGSLPGQAKDPGPQALPVGADARAALPLQSRLRGLWKDPIPLEYPEDPALV